MNEIEKMRQGLPYNFHDESIESINEQAMIWNAKYNEMDDLDYDGQEAFLREHLGAIGEHVWIAKTFHCNNGKNIFIGDDFTANFHFTVLDVHEVHIGNHVMIGPNVMITTVNHPLSPKGRRAHLGIAQPVTIGDDVWIGGNVSILPGVTIGNNVVIAAGAVVNKDVPDNCVVGGIPAKIIKEIENDIDMSES